MTQRVATPDLLRSQDGRFPARVPECTLAEEVAQRLKAAILSGEIPPEQHLIEREVGATFGVSTIAVRDAFARLGETGLIVRRPRRGVFVASVTPDIARDLADVRIALDQRAVTLAVNTWSPAADREGWGILQAMKRSADRTNGIEINRLDHAFHALIWQESGSATVAELAGQLYDRLASVIRKTMISMLDFRVVVDEHARWLDSMRAQNIVRARSEVRRHHLRETESIVHTLQAFSRNRGD